MSITESKLFMSMLYGGRCSVPDCTRDWGLMSYYRPGLAKWCAARRERCVRQPQDTGEAACSGRPERALPRSLHQSGSIEVSGGVPLLYPNGGGIIIWVRAYGQTLLSTYGQDHYCSTSHFYCPFCGCKAKVSKLGYYQPNLNIIYILPDILVLKVIN